MPKTIDNKCPGAVYTYSSTLTFQGNVSFVNNTGQKGGALALCEGSKIVIGRQAYLKFIGNPGWACIHTIHLTESKTVKSCEVDHTEEPDTPTNQVEPEIWTCVGTVKLTVGDRVEC